MLWTYESFRARGLPPHTHSSTHCCLIIGMLTQFAAATATKGTQRATRGGAFCKRWWRKISATPVRGGVKAEAGVLNAARHLCVEVESHRRCQRRAGCGNVGDSYLPGREDQTNEPTHPQSGFLNPKQSFTRSTGALILKGLSDLGVIGEAALRFV